MLQTVEIMLRMSPQVPMVEANVLARCIDACADCAQACEACADACLGERDVQSLAHCIRLCLDCSDLCTTAVRVLSRQQVPDSRFAMRLAHLTALFCEACAAECERHALDHAHCGECARICRVCEDACTSLVA